MANEIDNLKAAVEANTSVEASAVTLLNNLSVLIKNAAGAGNLALVQQYADQINASSDALAKAITANTPATSTPPPVLTDKTYTNVDGVSIVVSQAGDTPAVGETVTLNGAPVSAGETFTVADGSIIVIGDDSKVVSYASAPTV